MLLLPTFYPPASKSKNPILGEGDIGGGTGSAALILAAGDTLAAQDGSIFQQPAAAPSGMLDFTNGGSIAGLTIIGAQPTQTADGLKWGIGESAIIYANADLSAEEALCVVAEMDNDETASPSTTKSDLGIIFNADAADEGGVPQYTTAHNRPEMQNGYSLSRGYGTYEVARHDAGVLSDFRKFSGGVAQGSNRMYLAAKWRKHSASEVKIECSYENQFHSDTTADRHQSIKKAGIQIGYVGGTASEFTLRRLFIGTPAQLAAPVGVETLNIEAGLSDGDKILTLGNTFICQNVPAPSLGTKPRLYHSAHDSWHAYSKTYMEQGVALPNSYAGSFKISGMSRANPTWEAAAILMREDCHGGPNNVDAARTGYQWWVADTYVRLYRITGTARVLLNQWTGGTAGSDWVLDVTNGETSNTFDVTRTGIISAEYEDSDAARATGPLFLTVGSKTTSTAGVGAYIEDGLTVEQL
ncbi:hypothetical protein OAU50_02180 [Planctomycetota bacterium]|nr:hypothetical protein [Planctomycetota bacterium]